MAETDPDSMADGSSTSADASVRRGRPARMRWLATAAGLAALAIGLAWSQRIDIAHRLIDRNIRQLKLSARYSIEKIGTGRELLRDISIGDPANPDLTINSLEIDTGWSGGVPAVTGLKLVGARLRGRFAGGHLSFGSLDALLLAPSHQPLVLPDIALVLRDTVASIGGDLGPIGIAVSGSGQLRDGFSGTVAMVAPALQAGDCAARGASFHGRLAVHDRQPRLTGPLQMAQLACAKSALRVQAPAVQFEVRLDPALDGGTARLALTTGAARLGTLGAARLAGSGNASLRNAVVAGDFSFAAHAASGPSLHAAQLGMAGHLRAALRDGVVQGDGSLSARGIAPDATVFAALSRQQAASAGTMAAPLLAAFRNGLARETTAARLSGSWILRHSASETSLVLPELHVDGAQTPHWLSLSRLMLQQPAAADRLALAGDFAMAARGFPPVRAHVRPLADGGGVATLTMPAWAAATSGVALPILAVHWQRSGGLGFDGRAVLSGAVPGGMVTGLRIPLQGSWSAASGLLLGRHCTTASFDRLTLAGLEFGPAGGNGQALTLCPGVADSAMVALSGRGLRVSLRSSGLQLDGRMNGSALKLASGAATLSWPGGLAVKDIDVTMTDPAPLATGGAMATAASRISHLQLAQLTASLGAQTAGQFSGGDVSVAAAPVGLHAASGDFRWANGRLTVDRTAFRVEDPSTHPVFAPIVTHDAALAMANGIMTGTATVLAATGNHELARLALVHDLASGTGHADVVIRGLTFDKTLQPKQLSALIEGMIADARGTLTGAGRFDWAHGHVTSSGRVATTGFDFAAAFGPVKGVAGAIIFTDLLGLVTAPAQQLAIASINPGIEVDDGTVTFALQPGHVLVVDGAQWPFLDGQLALLPTRLLLGATEVRRYELRVDGLDAAKFLARMDLSNLAATGTFDGNLPLVFDQSGGRIEQGVLRSRAPGGTVSYVGDLSYKDLSPMANYAFQALRALKYGQMRIGMDGELAGNIVTRVSMQGVGQGQGAKHNFVINQLARLPIRFNVNITAPFLQLVTSFRSFYDPTLVADPRTLGLVDAHGRPLPHPSSSNLPAAQLSPDVAPRPVQP